jgi:GH25 family lysozyme M1 (1,4-beta-N-acetylmuramidase)
VVTPPVRPRPTYPGAQTRQDGIDIFNQNDIPSFNDIRGAGIAFVIHRCSIGDTVDNEYVARRSGIRDAGLIRGSFHYYLHRNGVGGEVQANVAVSAVQRLGPGDLATSLDFEEAAVAAGSNEPPNAAAWRTELEAFLDTVETKLGRTPLIYTRRSAWDQHVGNRPDFRAPDFAHFGNYPLWVLHYAIAFHAANVTVTDAAGVQTTVNVNFNADQAPKRTDPVFPPGAIGTQLFNAAMREFRQQAWAEGDRLYARRAAINPPANSIPGPWRDWALFQYLPYTPGAMRAHGFATDYKVDFNVTRGGVYFLRGLADLGRTAPHFVGNVPCIAHTEPDGTIHVLEQVVGTWIDQNVARDMPLAPGVVLPPAAGDPSAAAIGNEQAIAYRSAGGVVHVLTRNVAGDSRWRLTTLSGRVAAFADPFLFVFQNDLHLVYWDDSNAHIHLTRTNGVWRAESFADRPGGAGTTSTISGSATAYVHQNALHVISRSRDAGHLFDFVAPAGAAPQDLTAASHAPNGQTAPAATYRPATYARAGQAPRIVFRALRGHIWEIERDTLIARDLSAAAGAATAAGSPSAVVVATPHIFYRDVAGAVREIFDDAGVWRTRPVCPGAVAASDPTAFVDQAGRAAVTFRSVNGPIRLVRFVNGRWTCDDVP